jgi:secondary thiamine-phosphate synthase enzyme
MLFQMIEVPICADREFEMIDITGEVLNFVRQSGIRNGVVYVITEHTTTGITVNEKLSCVESDILETLDRLVPEQAIYHHNHYLPSYGTIGGNAPGHLKSLLTGNHCVFPVVDRSLRLGDADSIYFCEFDGIKNRKYMLVAMGE